MTTTQAAAARRYSGATAPAADASAANLLHNGNFAARRALAGARRLENAREVAPAWWLVDASSEPPGRIRVLPDHLRFEGARGTRLVQLLSSAQRDLVLSASVRVRSGRAVLAAALGERGSCDPVQLTADPADPGFHEVSMTVSGPVDQVVFAAVEEGTVLDIADVVLRHASGAQPTTDTAAPAYVATPAASETAGLALDRAETLASSLSRLSEDLPLPGVQTVQQVTVLEVDGFTEAATAAGDSLEDLGVLSYTGPGYSVDKSKLLALTRSILPESAQPSLRTVARLGIPVSPLLADATGESGGGGGGGGAPQSLVAGGAMDVVDRRRIMSEPDDADVQRRRALAYLEAHAGGQAGPLPSTAEPTIIVPVPGVGTSVHEVQVPLSKNSVPRLALVETWEVRSYLGDVGLGRVMQVISLFPGERTQITTQTWRTDASTREEASSIFESSDTSAETRFTHALSNETGSAFQDQGGWSLSVGAKVSAGGSVGIVSGEASLEAGFAANHQEASQKFSKDAMQAVNEHAKQTNQARRSSMEHADSTTTSSGAATTTVRELSNTNLRRVLNFVCRELNQAYDTYVVLRDIQVAFFNGRVGSGDVVGLGELRQLLSRYVAPEAQDAAARKVLGLCVQRFSVDGELVTVLQQGSHDAGVYRWTDAALDASGELDFPGDPLAPDVRWRFKPGPLTPGTPAHEIPGLVTARDEVVMRTDNILVEAMLGDADALDPYATQLQDLDLQTRATDITWRTAETRRTTDALDLVAAAEDKVDAWTKIFPDHPEIEVVPAAAAAQR